VSRNLPQDICGPGGVRVTRVAGSDYMSRVTVPDVYPRNADPFRPAAAGSPGCVPGGPLPPPAFDLRCLTSPAQRPMVTQRATNYQLTVPAAPNAIALANSRFECDSIVLDVPSTAANSVFYGYGSNVSSTNGLEVQPGLPILIEPPNTREMWEIQRQLEFIAALLARQAGVACLPPYRAPRVVFNANEWFLTASAGTVISVMLFFIPELQ